MADEDPFVLEGGLPQNALPVHSFAVGYGSVSAVDDDGVQALPMVTILTNDGHGPMLLWSLDAATRLMSELAEAVPKSVKKFDPKYYEMLSEADEVIARHRRVTRRAEAGTVLGYFAAMALCVLLGAITGDWRDTLLMIEYIFMLLGFVFIVVKIVELYAHWRNDRKDRRAARAAADVDGV